MSRWTDRLWRAGSLLAVSGFVIAVAVLFALLGRPSAPTSLAVTNSSASAYVPENAPTPTPAEVPTSTAQAGPPAESARFIVELNTPVTQREDVSVPGPTEPPDPMSPAEIIEMTIAEVPGTWGVAFRDLNTGETYLHNGDDFIPAASLYKLIVMYVLFADGVPMSEPIVLAERHFGEAGEDEPLAPGEVVTVEEALELMITVSSNAAAYALAEQVGWNRLNEASLELGLEHTGVPVGSIPDQHDDWRSEMSSTSPADMLFFFNELAEERLVDEEASERMLEILSRQHIQDRLPALLPETVVVAHKTGNLPGIVNDAGIISGPGLRFILVALSSDVNEGAASEAIAEMAHRITETQISRQLSNDTLLQSWDN